MSKTNIEREDIVLYVFTLVLIGMVSLFLYNSEQHQMELIKLSNDLEIPDESKLSKLDSPELTFYKTQIHQTSKIAGHSSRALLAMTTVRYIGFLVGVTMIFLGAIMIIRGIRAMPTEVEGTLMQQTSFKIASSSPGILFSFFGMLIIVFTIWKSGDVSFTVYPVKNYYEHHGQDAIQPDESTKSPNTFTKEDEDLLID